MHFGPGIRCVEVSERTLLLSQRGNLEAHLEEIIFDREGDKAVVGQRLRALPHAGLVRVPVVARFHDFGLELRKDDLERFDGVLL